MSMKIRKIIIKEYSAIVILSQGKFSVIDLDDVEHLGQWNWHLNCKGYANRQVVVDGKAKAIFMHRIVNKTPDDCQTDHVNGDKLDNRKANLRNANNSQNQANKGIYKNNKSGFKGVCSHPGNYKWRSQISKSGKIMHLGIFDDPISAAKAYNKKAVELYGEYARLNDINS